MFSKSSDFWVCPLILNQGRIQPARLGGAISVIFGSQVLIRRLFSELYYEYCFPNWTKSR